MVDRSGQQLGNYRIIRPIGTGGFADVYLGEHIYLNTPVAIKILHTQLSKDDMDSFLKEARTIAHLIHPHIVRVTDFGVDSETPFLVMDYAPNGTLRQRHPRGSILPTTTILPYVKQIAEALQHAHDEKLIHRDIKPENMLVGRRNDVLLSDFGIALVAQSSRYQSTQDVVGTVAYMSPEQIQGKPRPASDQYSLAVVVYEWLSGERPFHGSFTELCAQHMFATPPPLREKVPTIPRDVEQVVTTALAKDPKQRFLNVQAFANALEQACQSQQATYVKPQPPTQLTSPTPPIQQHVPTTPAVNLSPYGSYPDKAGNSNPAATPSEASVPNQPKVQPWRFGKRQLIAALTGTLICGVLASFILISTPSSFYSLSPLNIVIACVLLGLALVTPEFFGAVFGSWVGLGIGGLGALVFLIIGTILYGSPPPLYWFIPLGLALVGFISGFAMFKTQGRYNILRTLGFSSFGAVVGIIFALTVINITTYGDSPSYYNFSSDFLIPLIIAAPVYIVLGLILLPLLLVAYHKLRIRIKRS